MSYPMGSQPPPGAYGVQQPPQQQWGYGGVGYGRPPVPPSQHYGSYGQTFQQNVFQGNAWQVIKLNNEV